MQLSNHTSIIAAKYFLRYMLRPKAMFSRRTICGQRSYADAGQDLFTSLLHDKKHSGTYVEIGAQDPIKNSNTYLLETEFQWRGISFERRKDFYLFFNWKRQNPCVQADATTFDYASEFRRINMPSNIDYLQVDIEPSESTLAALKKIPHDNYRFSTITFEHDIYQSGMHSMIESRRFLRERGYFLFAENVKIRGLPFEDWWIDPNIFKSYLTRIEPVYRDKEYEDVIDGLLSNRSGRD
jgi:hypothetical protein